MTPATTPTSARTLFLLLHLLLLILQLLLLLVLSFQQPPPGLDASWLRVDNNQVALETELRISYDIDNMDPSRFHDIHCLLHSGSALLYVHNFLLVLLLRRL